MKQYNYDSYSDYVKTQIDAYYEKIHKVWVRKDTVKYIAEMLQHKIPEIKKGLCHGSRNGHEVKWFRKALNCQDIYGTEIAESGNKYIIQWDFHDVKPEWLNSMDFVYSNSLDHAFDPKKCLNAWCSCLSDGGFLVIEHSLQHDKSTKVDPFAISYSELIKIVPEWTNREFKVSYLLEPEKVHKKRQSKLLFIEKMI